MPQEEATYVEGYEEGNSTVYYANGKVGLLCHRRRQHMWRDTRRGTLQYSTVYYANGKVSFPFLNILSCDCD